MIVSQSDLDSFHQFASRAIAQSDQQLSIEELIDKWRLDQEREATIASIRRGLDDAAAGRVRELSEVDREIREKLGFPVRNS